MLGAIAIEINVLAAETGLPTDVLDFHERFLPSVFTQGRNLFLR